MGYATNAIKHELMEQANNTMSFPEFMYMCEEKAILPHLVNRRELEEIFRKANFSVGDKDKDEIQVSWD